MKSTHSQQLERWLGPEAVKTISDSMVNWYGPDIPLSGVPGNVYARQGGDFVGEIRAGYEMSVLDRAEEVCRRLKRGWKKATSPRQAQFNTGFASLSALIAAATGGKRQEATFQKVGTTSSSGWATSLWQVGNTPGAGGVASAAPGGDVCTSATTGSLLFTNPSGTDTAHFVGANVYTNQASNSLLLYDRLFSVAKTMNSASAEAVTGVPTRYQSTTPTDQDYIAGNFLTIETATALAATTHTWTNCEYTNQTGSGTSTLPTVATPTSSAVNKLDLPNNYWFAPLASGDVGIKNLTQMQCSASVATGAINFVIGHPLAYMPCPVAYLVCNIDGINTAFNMVRIFNDACLALMELPKPTSTAATYNGSITIVSG
ncbi:MAG: hypothetical protein V5B36_00965 [Candidatus Accumulibacter sp. UW25]|jgi:hypothetical protein